MNGPTAPTVRIVLDLNDLELAQFRRLIDEAPSAALNGRFIEKALTALAPHVSVEQVNDLDKADAQRRRRAHLLHIATDLADESAGFLFRRQAE